MARADHIIGVLLAGGLSRRMFAGEAGQGDKARGDKGLLMLGDKPMITHVADRLRPQVAGLVLNANGDPTRFAALGLPVAEDTITGFIGPLAGVLAGLRWVQANAPAATHIATVSTDAPFLPADLVARLREGLAGASGKIAIARAADGLHPVIGLWPVDLADDLEAALRDGLRKVLDWTDRHGTVPVDFEPLAFGGQRVSPFFNANTPEELEEARALLRRLPAVE